MSEVYWTFWTQTDQSVLCRHMAPQECGFIKLVLCLQGSVALWGWSCAKTTHRTVQRLDLSRACSAATVLPIKPEKRLDSDSESLTREMVLCCPFECFCIQVLKKRDLFWEVFFVYVVLPHATIKKPIYCSHCESSCSIFAWSFILWAFPVPHCSRRSCAE